MPASHELGLNPAQLRTQPLLARDPLKLEPPVPRLRADVREPEKLERFRLRESARLSALSGEPPKLDQPRLALVQPQIELREPLAKTSPEPLGVPTMLESHHEVVRITHDDHLAARVTTSPLVDPQVKDVVQVHVRQERRDRRPLRRALHSL